MALKPCPECGTEVSSMATACPKCGSPVTVPKKKTSIFTLLMAAIFGFILLGTIMNAGKDLPAKTTPAPTIVEPPEKQKQREELLTKLRNLGVFGKVDCRDVGADVWVQPAFYALEFDDKQSFTSVVYAYCFGPNAETAIVNLVDSRSGKEVGEYSRRGLEME